MTTEHDARADDRGVVHGFLRASLWDRVPRDHRQSGEDFRRRRWVTAAVTVVGAAVLAWSLNLEPGSRWFYVATLLLAAVWTAGAFASGPLHLGRIGGVDGLRRPIVAPIILGLGLAGVFVLGGLVIREIDTLDEAVDSVLDFARQGSGPLVLLIAVVNAIAEELFFRGALYAAIRRRQILLTTVVYGLAVIASGNVVLGFAALVLGTVVGWQRRASGGILAPILTHVTWSLCMLAVLPRLFS